MRPGLSGIGFFVLIVMIGWPAAGGEVVSSRVTPQTGLAPADIKIQAFIEPNVLNREISFVVESSGVYASSSVELEGDRAARTKQVRFGMLPAGSYEVTVTLYGRNRQPRGHVVDHVELW